MTEPQISPDALLPARREDGPACGRGGKPPATDSGRKGVTTTWRVSGGGSNSGSGWVSRLFRNREQIDNLAFRILSGHWHPSVLVPR